MTVAKGKVHVIKNDNHQPCATCGGQHNYISRKSNHARCGAPVGFSYEAAIGWATTLDLDPETAVIVAPDDTVVVLDDSARKLRQQGGGTIPLDQLFTGMRMA